MRTVGRVGRALRRFFAGARRARRGVPVHVVPGPPPHWVERVRQGAPGLLEPAPREQVHVDASPVPHAEAVTRAQRPLARLRRSVPRRIPVPRAAEPAHQAPPPVAETPVPGAIVRQSPPPVHGSQPPAAAVSEQAGSPDRPAASAASAPARPPRLVRAAAFEHAPPTAAVRPAPVSAVSRGLSPIPAFAAETPRPGSPSAMSSAPLPQSRPRLVAAPQSPLEPYAERAAIARLELAVAARMPAERTAPAPEPRLAAVRDPWPELPQRGEHHDPDPDATLRALARARRLDDEQGRL